MNPLASALKLGLLLLAAVGAPAFATQRTVVFENEPQAVQARPLAGRYNDTPYGGLLFPANGGYSLAQLTTGWTLVSSPNSLAGAPGWEQSGGVLQIDFSATKSLVSLYAGSPLTTSATLVAYSSNGAVVASQTKPITAKTFVPFSVSNPTPVIARVVLTLDAIGSSSIPYVDNVVTDGNDAGPYGNNAVTVSINNPAAGTFDIAPPLNVQGQVASQLPLASLNLTVAVVQPPNLNKPNASYALTAGGASPTWTFSRALNPVDLGEQTLTVTAQDGNGNSGTASVTFTHLPVAITSRYTLEGGLNTLGLLHWALDGATRPAKSGLNGCKLAVYSAGAIASNGNTTFKITGTVFSKWQSLIIRGFSQSSFNTDVASLGCPTSELHATQYPNVSAQEFAQGRIYVLTNAPNGPSTTVSGTFFVPAAFVAAIDSPNTSPNGEPSVGYPTADPQSAPAAQVWLFQHFHQPLAFAGRTVGHTVLEIKDVPEKLWVERAGTDWYSFACSSGQGPCNLVPPPVETQASEAQLKNACDFIFGLVPEWRCVPGMTGLTNGCQPQGIWPNGYKPVNVRGLVESRHLAGIDSPGAHDYMFDISSDMEVEIKPFAGFRSLMDANHSILHTEWERYYSLYFDLQSQGQGLPLANDVIFQSGRYIVDCGHLDDLQLEIHPPAVMVSMRPETYFPGNRPSTYAGIWVNGYFNGEEVKVDIFPPPRPRPNSTLMVSMTHPNTAQDVNVRLDFAPGPVPTHAILKLSSNTIRHNPVDWPGTSASGSGKMSWLAGRAYYGVAHVSWDDGQNLPVTVVDLGAP